MFFPHGMRWIKTFVHKFYLFKRIASSYRCRTSVGRLVLPLTAIVRIASSRSGYNYRISFLSFVKNILLKHAEGFISHSSLTLVGLRLRMKVGALVMKCLPLRVSCSAAALIADKHLCWYLTNCESGSSFLEIKL